jgi:hypothetical protein
MLAVGTGGHRRRLAGRQPGGDADRLVEPLGGVL